MTDKVKNQPVILPAQKVIKKKYVKPDFEVYELNWEPTADGRFCRRGR